MRRIHKYQMMVAAAALMVSTTAAQAASDADIQALQKQIDALSQQLNAMKAAPAPAAAQITKSPYDVLMTNPARGAFVIPGTNTTLHVGGFVDIQATYDTGTSTGPAGYLNLAGFNNKTYVANAATGVTNNSNIALPGTPYAHATGRFQMDPRFSRFNFETDTPSEWGTVTTVLEFDMDGDGLSANQKATYSVSPRLRRGFITLGNWTVGQTQQISYDTAGNPNSLDNNSFMGQESGNRWPQITYRWNIDAAQKHQVYAGIEAPYADFAGAAPSDFQAGGGMAYQTNSVSHLPDISAKYVENGSWGRFFTAGTIRNIEVNTDGLTGAQAFSGNAAALDPNPIHKSIWGGFIDAGAKVYTPFGDPRSNVGLTANWGTTGGRAANYSGGTSVVIDQNGGLHTQPTAGGAVSYNHWFNDFWQANFNYGVQHQWSQTKYQSSFGLWKNGQESEVNVFWMPTNYVKFGLAWFWMGESAMQGQCLGTQGAFSLSSAQTCTGNFAVITPGATRLISGASAYNNRFEFGTRVTF